MDKNKPSMRFKPVRDEEGKIIKYEGNYVYIIKEITVEEKQVQTYKDYRVGSKIYKDYRAGCPNKYFKIKVIEY